MTKSTFATLRCFKLIDTAKSHLVGRHHDELSNPVAAMYLIWLCWIRIEQNHEDLTAVSRINQTRGIETTHSMAHRETASRKDECSESIR